MKLLLFGDVHSNKSYVDTIIKKSKNVDLLVCVGDISMFQSHMKAVLKDLNSIGKKILMLPGNHEIEEDLEEACQKFENIIYLHKDHFEIDDFIFFAYGSGGFAQEDRRFEKLSKKWEKLINQNNKAILLTHGPPYKTALDKMGRSYVGCKSYNKFIEKVKPILAVSGHIHESFQKTDKIGDTVLINPGPEGKLYKI